MSESSQSSAAESAQPGPSSDVIAPVQVSPAYSYLSDKLRRLSSGSLQCSLFCGGKNCKYESGEKWGAEHKAVGGVFSHWVTPNILAMSRPSSHLIRNGNLIEEFTRYGIKSVINLQLPWEHAKCGPGVEQSSGFTYCPEEFMANGVYFYNYGWMDYGVPTLPSMLDVVKVMDFALSEGKVAVHCHAGLGRTGVLIACYLAYTQRLNGAEAVAKVREKRPGSIQTRPQIDIVHEFASFLSPLWIFFPTPPSWVPAPLGLEDLIQNQSLLLHGDQERNLKSIPKVLEELCGWLEGVWSGDIIKSGDEAVAMSCSLLHALEDWSSGKDMSAEDEHKAAAIKDEMNSSLQWKLLRSESSPAPLLHLITSFLSVLKEPLLPCVSDAIQILTSPSLHPTDQPRPVTTLRITDTFKSLLLVASQATPTGPAEAGVTRSLPWKVGVRLLTYMLRVPKTALVTPERRTLSVMDTLLTYWSI